MRRSILFTLSFFLLVGCASTSPFSVDYDAEENKTTYETSTSIPGLKLGGGYGGGTSVHLRALSGCFGESCQPKEVALVFQASGGRNLRMENRSAELTADGETFRSTGGGGNSAQSIHEVDQVSGNLATLTLSFEEFKRFAEAQKVTGEFGSSDFTLSYDRRSRFRALAQRVEDGPQENRR